MKTYDKEEISDLTILLSKARKEIQRKDEEIERLKRLVDEVKPVEQTKKTEDIPDCRYLKWTDTSYQTFEQ